MPLVGVLLGTGLPIRQAFHALHEQLSPRNIFINTPCMLSGSLQCPLAKECMPCPVLQRDAAAGWQATEHGSAQMPPAFCLGNVVEMSLQKQRARGVGGVWSGERSARVYAD